MTKNRDINEKLFRLTNGHCGFEIVQHLRSHMYKKLLLKKGIEGLKQAKLYDDSEHEDQEEKFKHKIAVKQTFSTCGKKIHYSDSLYIYPQMVSLETGLEIPYVVSGHHPVSHDLINFSVNKKMFLKQFEYFTINTGRTGNETLYFKPISIKFSKHKVKERLQNMVEGTMQELSVGSGVPLANIGDVEAIIYGDYFL